MTIVKIHGCSGAGKSTAVREAMGGGGTSIIGANGKIEAYRVPVLKQTTYPTFVLGSYENTCGGVDTISSAQEVMRLLDKYATLGNVLFEGLLQSTYYGVMGEHSKKYGDDYIYAFLDTPAELCLQRVVERRARSGRNNKFNPQLTLDKHKTIEALKEKLQHGQHRVVVLKHDLPMAPQLLDLIK